MKKKLQQWGAVLVAMGGAALVLPATGMQLRIFNLFGGASPAVSVACMVLGAIMWLIGTMLGASLPAQTPKAQPVPGSPPVPPPVSPRNVTNCPKCGQNVGPADRFCMACGNPLPQTLATPHPPPVSERPKRANGRSVRENLVAGLVAGVTLAGVIVLSLAYLNWPAISSKIAATLSSTLRVTPTTQPSPSTMQYDKALNDFTEAIRLKPDVPEEYYNRGTSFLKLKRYDEAISDLSRAIQLRRDYSDAYNNRGVAYLESKRYANALGDFTEAIQLKEDPQFYRNRAATWEAAGQHANALQDTQQADQLERSR
jgi:tetratricopeptide (TPR) repeat protein